MNCKQKVLTSGLILLLLLSVASSAIAIGVADVSNTVHNLSATSPSFLYATDETQVCIFCHTPHGGSLTGPLWNRADPDGGGGFTFYTSSTVSAFVSGVSAVSPESMMCLGCHDGSVSINHLLNFSSAFPVITTAFNGQTNTTITGTAGANMRIGGSPSNPGDTGQLGDDHPISFSYRDVFDEYVSNTKAGLHDPTDVVLNSDIRLFGGLGTGNERVECSSCHDPHVDAAASLPGYDAFLIMPNTGSALCLACHDK